MRLELTRVGLLVELANHYTTRGAYVSEAVGEKVCVCMCVCEKERVGCIKKCVSEIVGERKSVCVRERERERERVGL